MSRNTKLVGLFLLILLSACAPSRFIEPLEEGEKQVMVSLGGPLIQNLDLVPVPIPQVSLSAGKGITDRLTYYNSMYLTSLLDGVLHIDFGAVCALRRYDDSKPYFPGISSGLKLNIATDFFNTRFKLWPQIDFELYWKLINKRYTPYIGLENWYELIELENRHPRSPGQAMWLIYPHLGCIRQGQKYDLHFELKYMKPYHDEQNPRSYDYLQNSAGYTYGVFVGFTTRF